MTDQDIRIAIATACGWRRDIIGPADDQSRVWRNPEGCVDEDGTYMPDYADDLDAMFSAEETLLVADGAVWNLYARQLDAICAKDGDDPRHACSYQRAQAFVRTIAARAEREASL